MLKKCLKLRVDGGLALVLALFFNILLKFPIQV